jgi:hypothetical protein
VRARAATAPTVMWPLAVVVATAAFGTIPRLVTTWFYQRGDTAVQFAPTWYHLGRLTSQGVFPAWMDPGTWAGGNYAAEALFGIYDPLNIPVWLAMYAGPDLMTTMFLVKLAFLVLLALGTYFLCREYDADPWAAASVAVALPFSGFTLFWDAGSWASGLIAFAYTPWVWYLLRRTRRGTANPLWGFVAGVLAVLQGNPYGVLALVVVGLALVVEALLERDTAGLVRLVAAGVCAALFLPLVYLPLLGTSDLTYRSVGALIANTGKLQPLPGDFLQVSNPTSVPQIQAISGVMKVPATYLAWFALPLLPWLRWGSLRGLARPLAAPLVVGAVYLALTLAPSKLWQFRWPLRVSEYLFLAVMVLLARALAEGLDTSRFGRKAVGSVALVLVPTYLAWAHNPAVSRRLLLGLALVVLLTAAAVATTRLGRLRTVALGTVLIVGTGLGVALQVKTFGENASSRGWHAPSDVAAIQSRFGDREGTVMQFSNFFDEQHAGQLRRLQAHWQSFLPGSLYDVAEVDAVNHYTGMGMLRFARSLCMSYDGYTKPCGARGLFTAHQPDLPILADLMKVQTVVAEPGQLKGVTVPSGWTQVESRPGVVVYQRTDALPWPGSRLSFVPTGAQVDTAASDGLWREDVHLSSTGNGGTAVFSMLGWPGWSATLDGKDLPVARDSSGLLTVRLPAGASGHLELTYTPPGLVLGLACAALGLLGALALGWFGRRRRVAHDDERDAEVSSTEDRPDKPTSDPATQTTEVAPEERLTPKGG